MVEFKILFGTFRMDDNTTGIAWHYFVVQEQKPRTSPTLIFNGCLL